MRGRCDKRKAMARKSGERAEERERLGKMRSERVSNCRWVKSKIEGERARIVESESTR